jgi:hypothetical protein
MYSHGSSPVMVRRQVAHYFLVYILFRGIVCMRRHLKIPWGGLSAKGLLAPSWICNSSSNWISQHFDTGFCK